MDKPSTGARAHGRTRRWLVARAVPAGAVVAGGLVGCATGGQRVGDPAGTQKAQEPVTIEAWSPWAGTPADWEAKHAAFRQVHPHVTVQWTGTTFDTYLEKVTTAVAGGTPHDVSVLDNQHQGFFGRNRLLVDQAPFGKRDKTFGVEQFETRAVDLFTYDGIVLGYPGFLTTGHVLFNRALFQAAARPTPEELYRQGRWTWDAMAQAAVGLTRRGPDGKVEQLGLSHMQLWRLALNSNGTDLFDDFRKPKRSRLDEPAAIQAVEYIHDLAQRHQAAWRQPEAAELGGDANVATNQGKIAMHVSWNVPTAGYARYAQVYDKLGWVPFPKGPAGGGALVADLTTEALGIVRASQHHDAAWRFASWDRKDWVTAQLRAQNNPRIPSRKDLLDLARASLPAPQDIWFEMTRIGVSRPVFADWDKTNREIINPALNPVWDGKEAPRAAAQAVARRLNEYFAANPQ